MNTLKKLAVAVGLMAGLCSYAQPVPIKISSLVPVTNAQPNALVLLTIPGVTNYVITIANLQMQIGGATTNFAVITASDLSNLIYQVGANGTNFTYQIGANDTNYANSIFSSISNLIVAITNTIFSYTNTSPFTNNGMFIYQTGLIPSNNAPLLIRVSDGSHFFGKDAWADPANPWLNTNLYVYWAENFKSSNGVDAISGQMTAKDWLNGSALANHSITVFANSTNAVGAVQLYGTQGGKSSIWSWTADPNYGSKFRWDSNSTTWFCVSNGNLMVVNGVGYQWPGTNKAGVLTDDGTGNLDWLPGGSASAITNIAGGTNISIRLDGGTNFIDFTGTYDVYITNITVFSNAFLNNVYITNVTVVSNAYINNLYATNVNIISNATIKGNMYISQTNFVNYLVSTNLAEFGSNIYVAGTAFVNNLVVTNCPPSTNEVVVLSGTNVLVEVTRTNQTNFYKVNSTGGGGSVTNFGAIVTNVPYATNFIMDLSFIGNDYYMTNMMNNHINVLPTNFFNGLSWTMSLTGTNIYTNWNVYFTWPPSATVVWLSITNGLPTTTITSNKMQFYSFKCRTSSTVTQVVAAFKEQP